MMNPTNLYIRRATEQDIPQIVALITELDNPGDEALSIERARDIFAHLIPEHVFYVAELDRVIIGCFALILVQQLSHNGGRSALVEDVVVSPALQGRGIGRQMMQFAAERGREAGCYKLVLSSGLHRESAHRFYESLGFERYGYSFHLPLSPTQS